MQVRKQREKPRALLFEFDDGTSTVVPVTDASVFAIDGKTYAIVGVKALTLEDEEIAALELDVLGDDLDDLGTPVAEWGKPSCR